MLRRDEPQTKTTPDDAQDLLVAHPRDSKNRWFVLHTKSRQEKSLATALRGVGVSCYVPVRRTHRPHGVRFIESSIPLFRGYVFLWGTRDELPIEETSKRVATILEVSDQARLEWELLNVQRALSAGVAPQPCPAVRPGVRARVATGPLAGVEGVRDPTNPDRLVLQIGMLGAATCVDIHGELVESMDQ